MNEGPAEIINNLTRLRVLQNFYSMQKNIAISRIAINTANSTRNKTFAYGQ